MTPDGDGFERLWRLVAESARSEMLKTQPIECGEFLKTAPDPEAGTALTRQLGIQVPYQGSLETGVACRQSLERLTRLFHVSRLLDPPPPGLPTGIQSILREVGQVYLYAFLDAVEAFAVSALDDLGRGVPGTKRRKKELRGWRDSGRRALNKGRSVAAHGATHYVSAISEDGLWAPMLLFDVAGEGMFESLFSEEVQSDVLRFQSRMEQLSKTAHLAVAQGLAQLDTTAALIEQARPDNPRQAHRN